MLSTLQQWLTYIESLSPQVIDLGLERIKITARQLDLLTFSCPVITVGGTNGKGSCLTFIEAILAAAGWRVASYTSPHLLRFSERVRIQGQELSEQAWMEAFATIEQAREGLRLTYFEFTTLAALWLFKQTALDAIILEVGLGGRLDAVNCVDTDLAVIASIAMDHMDWLGDTREAIAREKAGIMRMGKPVIIGELDPPDILAVEAKRCGADAYFANKDFHAQRTTPGYWRWRSGDVLYEHLPLPHLPLQNAATSLMAIHCLGNKLPVSRQHIVQGLNSAWLPGRFQRFNKIPVLTIVDVAHNPASAELLAQRIAIEPIKGKIRAVFAMLADKDIAGSLLPLLPHIDCWYVADLDVLRGSKAEILGQHLQECGVVAYHEHNSVAAAYKAAQQDSAEDDCILVFGSFHTAAAVMEVVEQE